MRLAAGLAAARATGTLSRLARRGGGTSLPGKLLTRIAPDAIGTLAARLPNGSAVISATNGKTTTAAMVASILEQRGTRLVSNRAGANMAGGVASALATAATLGGRRLDGDSGLFEVDEFWLGGLVSQIEPRALLLSNLFRDQLDRYGELETIGTRWQATVDALPVATRLVLCADDPLVAGLGRDRENVRYFGVEDDGLARTDMQHAADSKHCRRCGAPYVYDAIYLGHLGRYHCPNGDARRPSPSVYASAVRLDGVSAAAFTLHADGATVPVRLPLPGLYNVYNAVGAAALALELGATLEQVAAGLGAVAPAFGRAESLTVGGRQTSLLLIKNPAGANEVLRTLALEDSGGEGLDLLAILNDRVADGRDVSWVWDADWELLRGHVRRAVCGGTRASELAVRLKYAGIPEPALEVVEGTEPALERALAGSGPLYVLPTYTALLELRELLARRGAAREYWR